jgi:hypothetical protein
LFQHFHGHNLTVLHKQSVLHILTGCGVGVLSCLLCVVQEGAQEACQEERQAGRAATPAQQHSSSSSSRQLTAGERQLQAAVTAGVLGLRAVLLMLMAAVV